MIKFLRRFSDRLHSKLKHGPYVVTYKIFFDGDEVNTFTLTITARSQEHAWEQVKKYLVVKPVGLARKKETAAV